MGSKPAKEWIKSLERSERLAKLKADEIMARLELKPGDLVADIGAGSGVYSWPLARAVAPGGTLYAVEVDRVFSISSERARRREDWTTSSPCGRVHRSQVTGSEPGLGYFHNVLHHIEGRQAYLQTLSGYLKPNARIVIIGPDRGTQRARNEDDPGSGQGLDGRHRLPDDRRILRLRGSLLRRLFPGTGPPDAGGRFTLPEFQAKVDLLNT